MEFLEKRGWFIEYYFHHKLKVCGNTGDQLPEISKNIEIQKQEEKLRNSKFAIEYRKIAPRATETPDYLTSQDNKRSELELKARFRLGTETKAGMYWTDEESRKCRLHVKR